MRVLILLADPIVVAGLSSGTQPLELRVDSAVSGVGDLLLLLNTIERHFAQHFEVILARANLSGILNVERAKTCG